MWPKNEMEVFCVSGWMLQGILGPTPPVSLLPGQQLGSTPSAWPPLTTPDDIPHKGISKKKRKEMWKKWVRASARAFGLSARHYDHPFTFPPSSIFLMPFSPTCKCFRILGLFFRLFITHTAGCRTAGLVRLSNITTTSMQCPSLHYFTTWELQMLLTSQTLKTSRKKKDERFMQQITNGLKGCLVWMGLEIGGGAAK